MLEWRSKSDSGYNSHSHYFLGKVRQGGNPMFATAPAHLRLGQFVNWTSEDRSNKTQILNPGFSMEWSMAIAKDWHRMNVMLGHPTWSDIVMSRARHPNIIMEAKEFDTKLSESRDLEGDHICTHPSKHKDPVTGAKEVVDHHKLPAGRRT